MVKWKESTVLFGTMYICTCKYLFLCSLKHFKVTFIGKKNEHTQVHILSEWKEVY